MPRTLPAPVYLLLSGLLLALWLAAFQAISPFRGSWIVVVLLVIVLNFAVELLFRAVAERRIARRAGRTPATLRALVTRPIDLVPVPGLLAYLGQTVWGLAANAVVLLGVAVLLGSRTFPFFTVAFPLIVANALLRPLLVERNPLGYWPGRGLYRRADPH